MKILLGAMLILLILMLTRKFVIGNPISRFLGAISYEIYLIHNVSFRLLSWACPGMNSGVYVVLSLTLSIAMASGIHRISGALLLPTKEYLMKKH